MLLQHKMLLQERHDCDRFLLLHQTTHAYMRNSARITSVLENLENAGLKLRRAELVFDELLDTTLGREQVVPHLVVFVRR